MERHAFDLGETQKKDSDSDLDIEDDDNGWDWDSFDKIKLIRLARSV